MTDASSSIISQQDGAEQASDSARKARSEWVVVILARLFLLALILSVWHYVVSAGFVPEFYISTPYKMFEFLWEYITGNEIWIDAAYTISETLAGFIIGGSSGIVAGLLLARFPFADRVLGPFLAGFNAMPRVALAPLFILWFGIGPTSKVALSITIVFFITMINTQAGARATDGDILMMGRAIGATQRQIYMKIILPAAIPFIFAGLRLAAVYALLSTVVGEMLAAQHGWGRQITYHSQTFEVHAVFGVLVVLALFSLALNQVMLWAEKRLLRWKQ